MKLVSKFIVLFFLNVTLSPGFAQELIMPLSGNNTLKATKVQGHTKKNISVELELPFFDDFFENTVRPNYQRWSDKVAYINQNYTINPPSLGVATLDAIDENGSIYLNATFAPRTFQADTLSTQNINLQYHPSDSIYLSFFYQPGGNGLAPEEQDSLCVDFYNPSSKTWHTQWNVAGENSTDFKLILLPIKDTAFLKPDFKFRFRNLASLPANSDYLDKRGNVDHWNIDYVLLDKDRSISDTVFRDIAFRTPMKSLLVDYQSMPWKHFNYAHFLYYSSKAEASYVNNDTATRNVSRYLEITDLLTQKTYNSGASSNQDISPGAESEFIENSFYPFEYEQGNRAEFLVKAWLRTDEFDRHSNDTLYKIQEFKEYFSYDDGSAERSYGLRGQGSNNGAIAVKFKAFTPDTLTGIDIYFTQLKDSLNLNYYYKFQVWEEDPNKEGRPGNLIYDGQTDHSVKYGEDINEFVRYHFDDPILIDGTFFVGIQQYDQYMLNIGLDLNNKVAGTILYNLGSEWQFSEAPGSLMMRPLIKHELSTSFQEHLANSEIWSVWPNPANDILFLNLEKMKPQEPVSVLMYDISGKNVLQESYTNGGIMVAHLAEGIYFLRLENSNKRFETKKLIIKH